jgi:SPP1 family phage portal protein
VWDKDKVTYFQQDEDSIFYLDTTELINPSPHWISYNTTDKENIIPHAWGQVPFICFKNNNDETTDLEPIKSLIDSYDVIRADFDNNLADLQDCVWVLKGYEGTNLSEIAINLKTKKVISVSDGDAEPKRFDVPYKARESAMNSLRRDIFLVGMGVNTTDERFNEALSGIALKQMYSLLDLKCDSVERNFKVALNEFSYFICEYLRIFKNKNFNHNELKFIFNRANIANVAEMVENCQKSKGIISDETNLENHPFVIDVEKEKKRIDKEMNEIEFIEKKVDEVFENNKKNNDKKVVDANE